MADMPLGAYDTIGNVWEMVDHRGVAENFGVGWDSGTLPRGPLTHSPMPVPPDRRVGFRCQRDTIPLFSRCSAAAGVAAPTQRYCACSSGGAGLGVALLVVSGVERMRR